MQKCDCDASKYTCICEIFNLIISITITCVIMHESLWAIKISRYNGLSGSSDDSCCIFVKRIQKTQIIDFFMKGACKTMLNVKYCYFRKRNRCDSRASRWRTFIFNFLVLFPLPQVVRGFYINKYTYTISENIISKLSLK